MSAGGQLSMLDKYEPTTSSENRSRPKLLKPESAGVTASSGSKDGELKLSRTSENRLPLANSSKSGSMKYGSEEPVWSTGRLAEIVRSVCYKGNLFYSFFWMHRHICSFSYVR